MLLIILNRMYKLLTKVKNQSPFLGALILVTLLFSFTSLNIIGFYFMFKHEFFIINIPFFILFNIFIFILLYFYSRRHIPFIKKGNVSSPSIKNLIVLFIYLFTLISFIFLANINREKILKENKHIPQTEKRESLEGKIRKWFKNKTFSDFEQTIKMDNFCYKYK